MNAANLCRTAQALIEASEVAHDEMKPHECKVLQARALVYATMAVAQATLELKDSHNYTHPTGG